MRIAKISAATLALALPVMSGASLGTALAADAPEANTVKVNVNLGKDAADSKVTLSAGGNDVETKTADGSGAVSFDYRPSGQPEQLTVTVDGETIVVSQAKCQATVPASGEASDEGSTPAPAPETGGSEGAPSNGDATTPGTGDTTPDEGDKDKPSEGDKDRPADKDKDKPAEGDKDKPTSTAAPAPDKGATDGSSTPAGEASAAIAKELEGKKLTEGEINDLIKDFKDLKSGEARSYVEKNAPGSVPAEKVGAELNSDIDKALDVLSSKADEAKSKGGSAEFSAEEASAIGDAIKSFLPGIIDMGIDMAPIPDMVKGPLKGIINNIISGIGGSGGGGGILDSIKGALGLGGGSSDVVPETPDAPEGGAGETPETPETPGGGAGETPETPEGSNQAAEGGDATPPPAPQPADLEVTNGKDSFTVSINGNELGEINCSADTDAVEEEKEDKEKPSETTEKPKPQAAAPVNNPQAATPGPKVNTGGGVEGASVFAKIKALFA